jgi:hypothetical protein
MYKEVIKERDSSKKTQLDSKQFNEVTAQRVVRNVDPFERKRRLAQAAQGREFKMVKIQSSKEAREERALEEMRLNPSQYLKASSKAYEEQHTANTPLYKPWAGGIANEEAVDGKHRFGQKQTEYLKSKDFNPLKDKFFKMKDSPVA